MAERELAGSAIKSYMEFLKKKKGPAAHDKCAKDVGLEGEIFPAKAYPAEKQANMMAWMRDKYGDDFVYRAGKYSAKQIGTLDFIAKLKSVDMMLKVAKVGYNRSLYYGSLRTEKIDKTTIRVILKDACISNANCVAWAGLIEGMLGLAVKDPKVEEIECQHRGDPECVFEVKW